MTSPATTAPTDAPTAPTDAATESDARRRLRQRVGGGFVVTTIAHLVFPKFFENMIPEPLGSPRFWNLSAAAAEATAAALLLSNDPDKRLLGGKVATATLIGVYPGNIKMALDAGPPKDLKAIGLWLRLPMQFPMIRDAWTLARPEVAR